MALNQKTFGNGKVRRPTEMEPAHGDLILQSVNVACRFRRNIAAPQIRTHALAIAAFGISEATAAAGMGADAVAGSLSITTSLSAFCVVPSARSMIAAPGLPSPPPFSPHAGLSVRSIRVEMRARRQHQITALEPEAAAEFAGAA